MPGPSQPSTQLPANVATTADLENLKKELTKIVQSEVATAKRDILDGNLLNLRCGRSHFFTLSPFVGVISSHVKCQCIVVI